ncbi:hypothetical protein BDV98DRAFT_583238 [Pterulicium gracile]|uniref:Uncharacterized protein n=1 Tax=Pterulicium gracile TaxID=1884261 RepID=A0A5C3QGE6_9AGAR|nr:hypothetical protein BDV98DRAFT_583238 [Pterula gracilis]
MSNKVLLATFKTCWGKSHCHNLPCGDQDSISVFKQHPLQGRGSYNQIMVVNYSTNKYSGKQPSLVINTGVPWGQEAPPVPVPVQKLYPRDLTRGCLRVYHSKNSPSAGGTELVADVRET